MQRSASPDGPKTTRMRKLIGLHVLPMLHEYSKDFLKVWFNEGMQFGKYLYVQLNRVWTVGSQGT